MSDIPSELLREILRRIPAEPLLRFRCVCKEWRCIIDDTSFIRSHLHHQPGGDQIMFCRRGQNNRLKFFTLPLESIYYFNSSNTKVVNAQPVINHPRIEYLPTASCDGLILITEFPSRNLWAVWNPYTRKSIKLKPIGVLDYNSMKVPTPYFGIGYDAATDDYKVVNIYTYFDVVNKTRSLRTLVYNLKLGYWRRLDDLPNFRARPGRRYANAHIGAFANNSLHWFVVTPNDTSKYWIYAFDVGTEKYSLLPLPSTLATDAQRPWGPQGSKFFQVDWKLSVVDGCLFLSCDYSDLQFDGWIMNKDTNAWTLLFSFQKCDARMVEHLKFIAYFKEKNQVLIQYSRNELLWFDIEKKFSKIVNLNFADRVSFTCQVIPASLVRPNAKGRKRKRGKDDGHVAASKGRKRKTKGLMLNLTKTNFV